MRFNKLNYRNNAITVDKCIENGYNIVNLSNSDIKRCGIINSFILLLFIKAQVLINTEKGKMITFIYPRFFIKIVCCTCLIMYMTLNVIGSAIINEYKKGYLNDCINVLKYIFTSPIGYSVDSINIE